MDGIYTSPDGRKIQVKDGQISYLVEPTNADGKTKAEVEAASAAVSDSETRENSDGIVQKGRNLGGMNALFGRLIEQKLMAPGTKMGQPNKYLSNYLPGTDAGEAQLELQSTEPEAPASEAPNAEKPAPAPQERTEAAVKPTVPETTGQSDSPQEGKSDVPDRADRVRRIEEATSNVKPTVEPSDRARAVSAFLDPRNKGYAAIRARDAAVGADLEGVGGAKFKDGMSRDARFELTGGAADSEEGAQKFAQQYLQKVVGVDRTSPKKGIAGSVAPETGKEYMGPAF